MHRNTIEIKNAIRKTKNSNAMPLGWFSISHNWVDTKEQRRKMTGKLHCIECGERKIVRALRFNATLLKNDSDKADYDNNGHILVDYDGWNYLSEEEDSHPLELKIRLANNFEKIGSIFTYPDPVYRIVGLIGIASVALGILGILLGLASLIISYIN